MESIPQGLKAHGHGELMYGLKPVPTSPYLPARTYQPVPTGLFGASHPMPS
jgi:hypothetical protein